MQNFDKTFEEFASPQKSETALKEFSNWIFGLSIGLCAFIASKSDSLIDQDCQLLKLTYTILLIVSMINAFVSGFNKFLILKRDSILAANQDLLKRIIIDFEQKKIDLTKAESEWAKKMDERDMEFKNIVPIGLILRISLVLTILTSLLTGIFIILSV